MGHPFRETKTHVYQSKATLLIWLVDAPFGLVTLKCQNFILKLHISSDRESLPLIVYMVCNNAQRLLGTTYDNEEERTDATGATP